MRKAKAVVIGIDHYPAAPLDGCVQDANTIASLLRENADGSKNFTVELLTAPVEKITQATLKEAVTKAFSGRANVALFYFAGHGIVNQSGGYLVAQDFASYDEGLGMDTMIRIANNAHQRIPNRLIILDCCHSGTAGGDSFGENIAVLREGMTIMAASRKEEPAMETSGAGGLFTSLVAEALSGSAADLLGNVTPGMVYAHVDRSLGEFQQRPIFRTNVEEFVPLRKATPPIELKKLQRITEFFEHKNAVFPLGPAYEFTSEEANPDNVAIFKILQEYRALDLVEPEDGDHVPENEKGHMYFAAMESRSCHLTKLGQHYHYLRTAKRF